MASQGQRPRKPTRWLALIAPLVAAVGLGAADPRPAGLPVALTVDVEWCPPPAAAPGRAEPAGRVDVELSTTAGHIADVAAWPAPGRDGVIAPVAAAPRSGADGSWIVGSAPRGKVRVRLDAPLAAELLVRVGGQSARLGLAALLEGAQKGVVAGPIPVEVVAERLAWDAIRLDVGDGDGTAEPGSAVPVSLRFNILTPEPAEVAVRCSAELRPLGGGEPVWRQDWREVVATDDPSPPVRPLSLTMPGPEGTYLLEVRTDWEPLGDPAGTRLGRWLRRRRNPAQTTSAARRATLAVVNPRAPAPVPLTKADGSGIEVDAVDLGRPTAGHRPATSGRSAGDPSGRWAWPVPDAALLSPAPRDRLRGWIGRPGVEAATLPPPDGPGLAWSAVGLRVPHPDRPHRLTLTVTGGHPAALGVAVIAGVGPGRGRVVLDACAAGTPILEGAAPATFSWPVWPGDEAPAVVLVNRGPGAPVQVGSITLTELGELAPAPAPRDAERSLGLHLGGPRDLDRFGGVDAAGRVDPLVQAKNLSSYLIHAGASSVVLPDGLADRAARRTLEGQADEDSTGPDRLDVMLRVLARRNCSAWVDLAFEGSLPGLPAVDSPEAAAAGLLRVDRHGRADGSAYQPTHPRVREAMARRVADAARPRRGRANLAGVLVRLGPGSTLPGGPDSGLDDATYARFVAAKFEPGPAARVPGRGPDDPGRFEARARFVEGAGKLPWLAWRAREVAGLYAGLADAARSAAPGATLAVATPARDSGPAGDEARRVDLAGLGPIQAWRGVGLDLAAWPVGDGAPIVLRSAGLSTDDLAHDLATSPELDEPVAARPGRGALLGVEAAEPVGAGPRLAARPMAEGAAGDEPLGHALAALDAGRVFVAAAGAVGQEDRLRRFARVFAALPAPATGAPEPRLPSGIVARPIRAGGDTYLAMANDTPYPILLEAVLATSGHAPAVDDLGRGIRLEPEKGANSLRLVVELAPFGVAATRIGSPDVRLATVAPYPGPAVLDGMKAQFDDLSTALARLNRLGPGRAGGARPGGPANPGFEADPALTTAAATTAAAATVAGWELAGELAAAEVDRDRPHGGRASLRLDARAGGASVASPPFRPDARSSLVARAWLRADRPDARVRVRIEGQSASRGYLRTFDVAARPDWAEVAVRAPQLPDGGLDAARVRFELLGPGRLWVDDVAVVGDQLGESEVLNARRDLMGALEAYRARRYAEFARLAGSHWSRHVAGAAASAAIAGERPGAIRTGDANALPPDRRKR